MGVVILRAWTSAILLFTFMLITAPKKMRLKSFKDIKYFIGTGIFSIIFFNYCLFTAIELSTIPMATALLYTAPARSEEHTSELQSRGHLVCRLLLEKKNT